MGEEAHERVWESLEGLRPARARVLRGEEGLLRNFRASRTTYLPVKPEAPRITTSNSLDSDLLPSSIFFLFCRQSWECQGCLDSSVLSRVLMGFIQSPFQNK